MCYPLLLRLSLYSVRDRVTLAVFIPDNTLLGLHAKTEEAAGSRPPIDSEKIPCKVSCPPHPTFLTVLRACGAYRNLIPQKRTWSFPLSTIRLFIRSTMISQFKKFTKHYLRVHVCECTRMPLICETAHIGNSEDNRHESLSSVWLQGPLSRA